MPGVKQELPHLGLPIIAIRLLNQQAITELPTVPKKSEIVGGSVFSFKRRRITQPHFCLAN